MNPMKHRRIFLYQDSIEIQRFQDAYIAKVRHYELNTGSMIRRNRIKKLIDTFLAGYMRQTEYTIYP